jgi:DNA-directed RNA polymerase subunit RPC12/RpoP
MPIQIECPGCKATLQVDDAMAGMQGKCIHCGQRIVVPGKPGPAPRGAQSAAGPMSPPSPPPATAPTVPVSPGRASVSSIGGLSPTLFEATPEAMARELYRRQLSAMLLLFKPTPEGSYDLLEIADADMKCIATEDITAARFGQLVASLPKRFAPRKKAQPDAAPPAEELLYELKGDRLGQTLEEFKEKYARHVEGNPQRLPLCSDTAWGANKASLRSETWHRHAGIIHARIDLPAEDNSPTVAGVKTEILLYQFIDGRLFGILAEFPTDLFHMVSEAAIKKYGPISRETHKPRQLIWENAVASVVLTRGTVHPVHASSLYLSHRQLSELAHARLPTGEADI